MAASAAMNKINVARLPEHLFQPVLGSWPMADAMPRVSAGGVSFVALAESAMNLAGVIHF